ncbi:MAG: hypothetical protein ABIU11_06275 [Chitinophagaceae bacterium]
MDNPLFVCNPKYPTNTEFLFPDLPGAINVISKIRDCDVANFATHAMSGEVNPLIIIFKY